MPEMRVVGVTLDGERGPSHPVLLLQEISGGQRVLPLWIGVHEAAAILSEQRGVRQPRPGTHQLIGLVIDALDRRLERVAIVDIRHSIFHAELVFDATTVTSARPSDAVALALHLGVPIHVEESVLGQAALPSEELPGVGSLSDTDETTLDAIEDFRRFLDSASPEDFDTD
ncbi:MAG TPA: bifunctional nuclease family protein [Pseudonocardia sp.]